MCACAHLCACMFVFVKICKDNLLVVASLKVTHSGEHAAGHKCAVCAITALGAAAMRYDKRKSFKSLVSATLRAQHTEEREHMCVCIIVRQLPHV